MTFNIDLFSIKKLFLVPYAIQRYHGNEIARGYWRFSKVIVPYVSLL